MQVKLYCMKFKNHTGEDCDYCYFKKNKRNFLNFYCDVAKYWQKNKVTNKDFDYYANENCKGTYVEAFMFLKKRRF